VSFLERRESVRDKKQRENGVSVGRRKGGKKKEGRQERGGDEK